MVQKEEQLVVPSINIKKETKQVEKRFIKPCIEEIMEIITRTEEAEKFLNYYESNGWKIGGRSPMKNWRAAAKNWNINFEKFNPTVQTSSNLHVNQEKDYEIPL
jgi:outer membrane receptor for Fe3+-dicitrate